MTLTSVVPCFQTMDIVIAVTEFSLRSRKRVALPLAVSCVVSEYSRGESCSSRLLSANDPLSDNPSLSLNDLSDPYVRPSLDSSSAFPASANLFYIQGSGNEYALPPLCPLVLTWV